MIIITIKNRRFSTYDKPIITLTPNRWCSSMQKHTTQTFSRDVSMCICVCVSANVCALLRARQVKREEVWLVVLAEMSVTTQQLQPLQTESLIFEHYRSGPIARLLKHEPTNGYVAGE